MLYEIVEKSATYPMSWGTQYAGETLNPGPPTKTSQCDNYAFASDLSVCY